MMGAKLQTRSFGVGFHGATPHYTLPKNMKCYLTNSADGIKAIGLFPTLLRYCKAFMKLRWTYYTRSLL